ncbi:auxin efflux carrier family protein [Striga asiatica]|uniref:Auxin efflux carrier family protein n=1 Tax=Striga asiatica TaxID=4170 RepID=A0A5A7RKE7_STRAF|nr:auxin efflux carrier family protein [Striga asiatica]
MRKTERKGKISVSGDKVCDPVEELPSLLCGCGVVIHRNLVQNSISVSHNRSCRATQYRYGGRFSPSNGGASFPIGHVMGWSLVAPTGSARSKNLSTMSSVRNGVSGCSTSDLLRRDRQNPGWIGIAPAILRGPRSSRPARAATWWTMFPPELSPTRKTRRRSAARSGGGRGESPAATDRSQRRAARPSSQAAGRRCSGARRR